MNKEKHKKGISIRAIGSILIITAILSIFLMLFGLQRNITYTHSLYELEQERLKCDKAIQQFMDGSDYLTLQVQQYAINGERMFMDDYWSEVNLIKSRDIALEIIMNSKLSDEEKKTAEIGKKESDNLIKKEIWVMRMISESIGMKEENMPQEIASFQLSLSDTKLSPSEKESAAIAYVFGPDYSMVKDIIRSNVNIFRNNISNRYADETIFALEKTQKITYHISIGVLIFFALFFCSLFWFTTQIITPLIEYSGELSKTATGFVSLREIGAFEIRQFANSFNALSEQVQKNTDRLAKMGYIDFLTNVPNRASITEYVNNAIKEKTASIGLLIVDIDNFKRVNDTFGHSMGDRVLQEVAKAVCFVKTEDGGISGRLCGEEFITVIKNADKASLKKCAETIIKNVRNITAADVGLSDAFHITVSVGGMITESNSPEDFVALLSKADKGLYISKETGKNRYTFFDE